MNNVPLLLLTIKITNQEIKPLMDTIFVILKTFIWTVIKYTLVRWSLNKFIQNRHGQPYSYSCEAYIILASPFRLKKNQYKIKSQLIF